MGNNSQHAHDLAKKLMREYLGEPAETLLSTLLRLGRAPFPEIARACPLPPKLLKYVLMVLMQHNFVRVWLQPAEFFVSGVRPPQYLYEPCIDWVLQLLRRPSFMCLVQEEVIHHGAGLEPDPDLAQSVMSVLLDHGRLTFDQVIKAVQALQLEAARHQRSGSVRSVSRPPRSEGDDENTEDVVSSAQEIRHMIFLLIQQHLIEQAPPSNLPPPAEPPRGRRKKDPKPGSKEWTEDQEAAKMQRPATLFRSMRFRVPEDLFRDTGDEEQWRGLAVSRWALEEPERLLRGEGGGSVGGGGGTVVKSEAGGASGAGGGKKRKKSEAAAEDFDETEFMESMVGRPVVGGRRAAAAAAAAAPETPTSSVRKGKPAKRRKAVIESDKEEEGEGKAAGGGAAVEVKEEPMAAAEEETGGSSYPPILWRANGEELNRRMRNRVCVKLVRDALGDDYAAVLQAMLEYSRNGEASLQDGLSVQMSEGDITNALRTAVLEGRIEAMPPQALGSILNNLETHSFKAVNCVQGGPGMPVLWQVDILNVLERSRFYEAVAAVKDKFGSQGVRVFQLLINRGQLEQKQVADLTMGPQKETRELLYRMMRAGYVEMQLIPRAPDRAPSRSFFTWRVDLQSCYRRMAADVHKAACNVWSRYAYVMEKHADIVAASRAAFYHGGSINLTEDAKPRMARLHAVNQTLIGAQLRLDALAALFCDYAVSDTAA